MPQRTADRGTPLTLLARTAADMMMPNPVSVRADASVRELVMVLTDRGYSAAPVIDEAGRPVGVVSRTDVLIHDREKDGGRPGPHGDYEQSDLTTEAGEALGRGFQVEEVDQTCVRDIMTQAVFSVKPETPAGRVVEEMLALRVHRLFVVDGGGVLIGVISALDVLRHLQP